MTELWSYLSKAVQLYALDIVIALLILIVGRWAARAIVKLIRRIMAKRNVDEALSHFLTSLIFALIMAFVFISALGQLGIQTTSLVAIVGAAGLAVGLALQGSLANLASGVMLITFRPFKAGDYVEAAGVSGAVQEVSIFNTTLKTPDNKRVIVPNAQITGGTIVNYSAEDKRRIDFIFVIGYDEDIRTVREHIIAVMKADERILPEPAPTVGVLELGANTVNLAVRPWVKTTDYWDVYFAINESIKQRFETEGIRIPLPQQVVYVHKKEDEGDKI
jgi:small conductance mechanosensitive channel